MSNETLSTTYDPHAIEQSLYEQWERAGYFAPRAEGQSYCIMIPPPNVTGSLHMGHAFQDTIMDALIRYHRMRGDKTLWQAGSDHAGIATQMVVERQLNAEGKSRHDLGRDEFINRIWEWKEHSGNTITRQLRRMGASLDWSRERFTMDEGLSNAVREVFIKLYQEGLIYRGKRLVNWDPVLHTAVSDLEVISEEENGQLWHMRYPLADADGHLVVATTRPETMLGDTAVAVHPDDERYKHLVCKSVMLPLVDREIPVIADDYVDPEFGSGCVKITPAHDFNDYEVGQRHDLPMINVLTPSAEIDLPESAYHGMDRNKARKAIVADLEKLNLLEKTEDHRLKIPRGDRTGEVIEPYLTNQWFVKAEVLAKPSIEAVEDGTIKFVPDNWKNTYYEWMRNIQDWCISRQIWWGHRIPAWYDPDGNIYVAEDEATAQQQAMEKHGQEVELTQDEDVLDTWFSSALWPFSTLGWPKQTEALKTFYTTSVLVTGFDIIFFWVARMIMMGLKFTGKAPFDEVYVHGLIRDAEGQKMSKSKGNVLDPLDLIDGIDLEALVAKRTSGMMQPQLAKKIERDTRKHFPEGISAFGTDALRFTFASLATQGRDIRFDLSRVEGYRNFCNKLWNASRFVLLNTDSKDCAQDHDNFRLGVEDKWIISRLQQTEAEVAGHIEAYRFDLMAQTLYAFVWDEYCSWYLEIAKVKLNDGNREEADHIGTRRTLVRVLETALRLLHPLMPFITEAIWQKLADRAGVVTGENDNSIMIRPYPVSQPEKIDQDALNQLTWLQEVVSAIRNIRGECNIEPNKRFPVYVLGGDVSDDSLLKAHNHSILSLARIESIEAADNTDQLADSATAMAGRLTLLAPLGAFIDKEAELCRLKRDIEKHETDLLSVENKLNNEKFVSRAPQDVVEKQRARQLELNGMLADLRKRYQQVENLKT